MASRRLRAGVPAVLVAALLAACTSGISGTASPVSGVATSSTPATSSVPFRGCTITAAGSNISSRSNVGISTITSNDGTRINCGGAGQLTLISIGDSEIVVATAGNSVTVPAGETKQVGPYQVAVSSVTNGTAVFTMALT
jgi:hypothetical protein